MTGNKVRSELEIIPRWARILAGLAAAACFIAWMTLISPPSIFHGPEAVVRFLMLAFPLLMGSFLAGIILLTGYVNRDARRRGMSAALWTLLVVVIPNGLGFIVYFIVRHPLTMPCPQCSAAVPLGVSFCASCGFKVAPVCPQCARGVVAGQPYCPHCGQAVAAAAPLA